MMRTHYLPSRRTTTCGLILGAITSGAALGGSARDLSQSSQAYGTARSANESPARYTLEPLFLESDGNGLLFHPRREAATMYDASETFWDQYSLFRINDNGQVVGWTNQLFTCDDDPNGTITEKPTAATWVRSADAINYATMTRYRA